MPKRRKRERREPHWLVPLLVGALLTATVTTNVIHDVWHVITAPFRGSPTPQESNVKAFFHQVPSGGIWASPPTTFRSSERYFLSHYALLDPTTTHAFRATPHTVVVEHLVQEASVLQGTFLMTVGRVLTSDVVTNEPHVIDTLVQIVPYRVKRPTAQEVSFVVYCRVPLRPGAGPRAGELILAEGIVAGAGNIAFNEGGFRPAVYMACAAIAAPRGRCGEGPVPPVPEQRGCPDYRAKATKENPPP